MLGRLPVRWRLETRGVDALAQSGADGGSFELGRTSFLRDGVLVVLPARKFLRQPETVREVVQHEAVHATFASQLGRARYEALPMWFREGVALLISGEGESAWRREIAYAVFQDRAAHWFVASLHSPAPAPGAAYVAVRWLRQRVGQKKFLRLLRRTADGRDFEGVLRAVAGFGVGQGRDLATTAARRSARDTLSIERETTFRKLHRQLRGGGSAVEAMERFLRDDEDGVLAGTAHYVLAKGAFRARRHDQALAHLARVLASRDRLWRPEALLLLARTQAALGQMGLARKSLAEVQEVFGEDRSVAADAHRLAARWAP